MNVFQMNRKKQILSYKKVDKQIIKNYRAVSLFPTWNKIFEKSSLILY